MGNLWVKITYVKHYFRYFLMGGEICVTRPAKDSLCDWRSFYVAVLAREIK